ncbi:MAG: hypothetical protein G01um101456_684 [Parcubacteria group bacterium Gr01-1014_56]|nr:MAG: hypothetical protein G01um101456_684 [Parcubacteria group bacterium Gr01-1014_56]
MAEENEGVNSYPNSHRYVNGDGTPMSPEQIAKIEQMWKKQGFDPMNLQVSPEHLDGPPKKGGLSF